VIATAEGDAGLLFLEVGAVVLALAVLAGLAHRLSVTAIPFYLVAGLAVGEGGIAPLDLSEEFISEVAEIGVLLLLLMLGLEYGADELRHGLRTGLRPGLVDAAANFAPGFAAGLLLGWETPAAVLLGGATWVSSSGIVAKVLADLDRLGNRETPAVLNLLVIEDLAMAAFLPVASALVSGKDLASTAVTVAVALAAAIAILAVALTFGTQLSALLDRGSDETLLLGVFGLTLLVGGLAQQLEVSAAIGAFLVGLALSGPVQDRAGALIGPLRDLFAALFFLSFSFQIDPGDLVPVLAPAITLAVVGVATKWATGWYAARSVGVGRQGRRRAGATLSARGEFSIVIASLGAGLADGAALRALAAAFVLLTAIAGPLAARFAGGSPPRPAPPRHGGFAPAGVDQRDDRDLGTGARMSVKETLDAICCKGRPWIGRGSQFAFVQRENDV
jgi:CPA2 family monovalent cation:H+ antiporter-2